MFSSNYFNEVDAQKTGEPDLFHFNSIPNQIFFFFSRARELLLVGCHEREIRIITFCRIENKFQIQSEIYNQNKNFSFNNASNAKMFDIANEINHFQF